MRRRIWSVIITVSLILSSLQGIGMQTKTAKAEVVTVSSLSALQDALDTSSGVDEIIITAQIGLLDGTVLDGNNKTVRAEVPGVNEQGILQEGSDLILFNIANGSRVSMKNLKIKGGCKSAIRNFGKLTLEGITISNTGSISMSGAIYNDYSGTVDMKRSALLQNVARNGGGFVNNGIFLMEDVSCCENSSIYFGGGVGENKGKLYLNNCVFSNNSSVEIGGAINNYSGVLYIMNSTFTGNVTTSSLGLKSGGGIGNNGGAIYAVNSVLAYNYYINDSTVTPCDIGIYAGNNIKLYNCIYGSVQGGTPATVENSSTDITNLFARMQTGYLIDEDGIPGQASFLKPLLLKSADGLLYVPVNMDPANQVNVQGTETYWEVMSDTQEVRMAYGAGFVPLGSLLSTFVSTSHYIETPLLNNRDTRKIGASGSNSSLMYTVTVDQNVNGSVSGGTVNGDSYLNGTEVTLTAIPDTGYQLKNWQIYNSGLWEDISSGTLNTYTFQVTEDMRLRATFMEQPKMVTINLEKDKVSWTGADLYLDAAIDKTSGWQYALEDTVAPSGSYSNDTIQPGSYYLYIYDGTELVYKELVTISDDMSTSLEFYTIHFKYEANGGTTLEQSKVYLNESEVTLPSGVVDKLGWSFVGWNETQSAKDKVDTYTVNNDSATLYSIYSKQEETTFSYMDGDNQTSEKVSGNIYNNETSTSIAAPVVTAPSELNGVSLAIDGWTEDTQADGELTDEFQTGKTYYARYSVPITLIYDANGGSSAPVEQVKTRYYNSYGTELIPSFHLAAATMKDGFHFNQWANGSVDSETTYAAESDQTFAQDTTLYATWTDKKAVSLLNSGQQFTYGDQIAFDLKGTDSTLEGFEIWYYVEGGWTKTAPEDVGSYSVKIEREEDVVYAAYSATINEGLIINPQSVACPVIANQVYTGVTLDHGLANTEEYKVLVEVGDSDTAIEQGDYTITLELSGSNYIWTDGSNGKQVVSWKIIRYLLHADVTDIDFGSSTEGYTQPEAKTITIQNTGNVSVSLIQPESSQFILGTMKVTNPVGMKSAQAGESLSLQAGGKVTFTVQPKLGLPVGKYEENLTVTTQENASILVKVSYVVDKRAIPPTATPQATVIPAPSQVTQTPLAIVPTPVPTVKPKTKPVQKISLKKITISKLAIPYFAVKKPAVKTLVISYKGKKLKLGKDYTITFKNNSKSKTVTLIMKGKGKYRGEKRVTLTPKVKYYNYVVTTHTLRGRTAPTVASDVSVYIPRGAKLKVVAGYERKLSNGYSWYKVYYNNKFCYVYSEYIGELD